MRNHFRIQKGFAPALIVVFIAALGVATAINYGLYKTQVKKIQRQVDDVGQKNENAIKAIKDVFATLNTDLISEGVTNKYFSKSLANGALSVASLPLSYDSATGVFSIDLSGYQPLDADLTSIAGLTGTSGLLRKTAANTYSLDTSTSLTFYTETDPIYSANTHAAGMNQGVATTNSPTFAGLNIGTLSGILKGTAGAVSLATDGTDYLSSTIGLKLDQTIPQTTIGRFSFPGLTVATQEVWVKRGDTIQSTIDAITDASVSKPYLVRIPPGVYTERVICKDYVSLKGAGITATKITYTHSSASQQTITPAIADVMDMTIEALGIGGTIGTGIQVVNKTFNVRNCMLIGNYDILYEVQQLGGNTYKFFDCFISANYDGFVNNSPSSKVYVYNSPVTAYASVGGIIGIFRNIGGASTEMHVYNSPVTGSLAIYDYDAKIVNGTNGILRVYNSPINITNTSTGSIYGVYATGANSNIEVYGGKISTTSAGTAYDLYRTAGTLNVYATKYTTSSGTIGGNMLFPADLTVTGIATVGKLVVNTSDLVVNAAGYANKVGIGTTTPGEKLEINGGLRLNTATAKPACDSTHRGTFWVAQGGAGVKDTVEVCAKDAADAYTWRTIY